MFAQFVCVQRTVWSVVASVASMLVHCENVCTLSDTLVVCGGSDRPAQFLISSCAVPVEKPDDQYRRAGAEY